MTIRIAILAACAGTLVLAQADVARASYETASESKDPVSSTDVGPVPAIMVAQYRIDPVLVNQGNEDLAQGTARKTLPKGKARRGSKISDSESPRPTDRKILTGAGPGAGPHRSNENARPIPRQPKKRGSSEPLTDGMMILR